MPNRASVDDLLAHLRRWWQDPDGLAGLDDREARHIARDLGLTPADLRDFVARGPHAADLLLERLAALGLDRADIEAAAPGLMGDLQKTCAHCRDKGVCESELVYRPGENGWQRYCPNASTLEALARAKSTAKS
jgi:hypothetical protein